MRPSLNTLELTIEIWIIPDDDILGKIGSSVSFWSPKTFLVCFFQYQRKEPSSICISFLLWIFPSVHYPKARCHFFSHFFDQLFLPSDLQSAPSLLGLLLLHPGHWPCQPLHSTTKGTPPKNNHFLSGIAQITSPLPLVKAKKISSIVVLHLCWCKCSSTFRDYSVKQRETIAWCLMDFSSKGTSPSLWVNIPLRIVPKILIWRWNFPSQKSQ